MECYELGNGFTNDPGMIVAEVWWCGFVVWEKSEGTGGTHGTQMSMSREPHP